MGHYDDYYDREYDEQRKQANQNRRKSIDKIIPLLIDVESELNRSREISMKSTLIDYVKIIKAVLKSQIT